jgi:DNA-3-methyladenine glycosylase II
MRPHILAHFQRVDPILFLYAQRVGPISLKKSQDYFTELCDAIISQQLSNKAGATILQRFFHMFPNDIPVVEKILELTPEVLRASGMSNAKVRYVRALAEAIHRRELILETLDALSDTEVIKTLTKLPGIGPWTAEMFLISTLGREDVFSAGDLGLRRAIQKIYKLRKEPSPKRLQQISSKWSPYRSYACKILWKSLELAPLI